MADEPPKMLSGKPLENSLQSKVNWSVSAVPLSDQLSDLTNLSRAAVLRDRRVDPGWTISLNTGSVSRLQVFRELAAELPDSAFIQSGDVAMIGPSESVSRLPVLMAVCREQLDLWKRLPSPKVFRTVSAREDYSWPVLSEPRQILEQAAGKAGVRIRNPELVPHDVWDAQQLPPLSFSQLACLVLIQFDLQPAFDESSAEMTIVPVDVAERFTLRHSLSSSVREEVTRQWESAHPEITLKWSGAAVTLTATLDQHAGLLKMAERCETPTSMPPATADSLKTRKFQLKADQATVADLLQFFEKNGVSVQVADPESPESRAVLNRIVRLTTLTDKMPGREFFPRVFGEHFQKVEVLDDRVILTP